jgi:hypothetical protein
MGILPFECGEALAPVGAPSVEVDDLREVDPTDGAPIGAIGPTHCNTLAAGSRDGSDPLNGLPALALLGPARRGAAMRRDG